MRTEKDLIREEQHVLDDLIRRMDRKMLQLDRKLTEKDLEIKKAEEGTDAYGMLISAHDDAMRIKGQRKQLNIIRNELYSMHLKLHCIDKWDGNEEDIDLKIGLHTYQSRGEIYIVSWKQPICRHYLLDNAALEYDSSASETGQSHFTLQMKRKVDLFFDEVEHVMQEYPIEEQEEAEKIIADSFLEELASRRSEREFRNIVFSIQKKQGEIIQTPFKQNLIVQGCAGSGKSMIMLHRLPVLLFDNPNALNKNNLYIITPSKTYMEMAEQLMEDLEIEDLSMGTLEQYYYYKLKHYNFDRKAFSRVDKTNKISAEMELYVYSDDFIRETDKIMQEAYVKGAVDLNEGFRALQIKETENQKPYYESLIRVRLSDIKKILSGNAAAESQYRKRLENLTGAYKDLANSVFDKRNGILKEIDLLENDNQKKEQEIGQLRPIINRRAIQNRREAIQENQNRLAELKEEQRALDEDPQYLSLVHLADNINNFTHEYSFQIKDETTENQAKSDQSHKSTTKFDYESYQLFLKKEEISDYFLYISASMPSAEELEEEKYGVTLRKNWEQLQKRESAFEDFTLELLDPIYFEQLQEAQGYYSQLQGNLLRDTYLKIMEGIFHIKPAENTSKLPFVRCSPYILLRLMYMFRGPDPNRRESLLSIDEAQTIAPAELDLLKKVNHDKVIFNLFGDVRQHIEGTKGFDDWQEISGYKRFSVEELNENYRNARQITKFCNDKLKTNMRAINLDGSGVHIAETEEDLFKKIEHIFLTPQKAGLLCIIAKGSNEVLYLKDRLKRYAKKLNDMTDGAELQYGVWNIMLIEQVKGLEFTSVIALSGKMTPNEKYIAYTRALDELYVYDAKLPVFEPEKTEEPEQSKIKKSKSEEQEPKAAKTVKKKRSRRTERSTASEGNGSELLKFFAAHGCKVEDQRESKGVLWVIGSRETIGSVVDEAVKRFKISGSYMAGKGWYTKSKL